MNQERIFMKDELIVDRNPYKHFYEISGISSVPLENILDWLENCNYWKRTVTDFYSQYEFSISDVKLPTNVSFLGSDNFQRELLEKVEVAFSTKLSSKIDIVAHKLVPNDIIGIHNDFIPNRETHRILIHINRSWTDSCGGYFMIFADHKPESLVKALPPLNGYVSGFEISKNSYHAVSKVHEGERYSIIYSFYRRN